MKVLSNSDICEEVRYVWVGGCGMTSDVYDEPWQMEEVVCESCGNLYEVDAD